MIRDDEGVVFTNVRRAHLWSAAADQIRRRIADGSLPPGSRLPAERNLSQELGISRVSLREAIRTLESQGYLDVRPGSGTYVRAPNALPPRPLIELFQNHATEIQQRFEVRELVEPGVAALAARHGNPDVIRELERVLDEMQAAMDDGDQRQIIAADAEFHHVLAHGSGNAIIDQLMHQVLQNTGQERRASLSVPGQVNRAMAGHREILGAIINRNPVAAEFAMRRHLQDARYHIDRFLKAARVDSPGGESREQEQPNVEREGMTHG